MGIFMNKTELEQAIEFCINKVDTGLKYFKDCYPSGASTNGIYPPEANTNWTSGFWTGMIWLAYEFTGDEKYKEAGLRQVRDFLYRIENRIEVEHHDMGFLYSPSCVAAYKLTGDENAKKAALMAADNLCGRFMKKGQFIQAWGKLGDENNYRLIIDCLMNLPLLFWAGKETNDKKYTEAALKHLHTAADVVVRKDGSTHHTFFFDPKTGMPDRGMTCQGYSDDSIWARGQAWGIYGFALAYGFTGEQKMYDKFMTVTEVFLKRLPKDNVPAWDMIFTDTETQKDSSSAPIAVCGILEMQKNHKLPRQTSEKTDDIMNALKKDYLMHDMPESSGILKHAVGAMPQKQGVDECNIWGDYFYMEALMRIKNKLWDSYWG